MNAFKNNTISIRHYAVFSNCLENTLNKNLLRMAEKYMWNLRSKRFRKQKRIISFSTVIIFPSKYIKYFSLGILNRRNMRN